MTLAVKQGDTLHVQGERLDDEGQPVSITGSTINAQLRHGNDVHTLQCEIVDGEAGTFTLYAPAAATADWPAKSYRFDVEFVSADGDVDSTVTRRFRVDRDNTRV